MITSNLENASTLVEFFNQFRQFEDAKTAYESAKQLFADYKNSAPYFAENGKIILSDHGHGYSQVIAACGGYFAVHVVTDENACVRWHGFNFKTWHVGIFAQTCHGLTLVGVVSNVGKYDYTWWANCHGEFYAENFSIDGYSGPDDGDVLTYTGSYHDFLSCVDAAAAFLAEDEGEDAV